MTFATPRNPLHRLRIEIIGVENDTQGISGERTIVEHIDKLKTAIHG